jgi:enoyl-CoA hydratase/carnithine racemase
LSDVTASSEEKDAEKMNRRLLLCEKLERGITKIVLNRPEKHNALSFALLQQLEQALDDLSRQEQDDTTRVFILASAGPKAFCTGHDLKEIRRLSREASSQEEEEAVVRKLFEKCSTIMQKIPKLPVPVIAQVQGIATAAGCQLVAACDLAVASDTATFAISGITAGLVCSTPVVPLSRNVGRKLALEMLLTGDFVSAETALQHGLVNRVVPPEDLEAETLRLAESIASKSAYAVRRGKEMFYQQLDQDLSSAYSCATDCIVDDIVKSKDSQEGIDAFVGKRKPIWKDE